MKTNIMNIKEFVRQRNFLDSLPNTANYDSIISDVLTNLFIDFLKKAENPLIQYDTYNVGSPCFNLVNLGLELNVELIDIQENSSTEQIYFSLLGDIYNSLLEICKKEDCKILFSNFRVTPVIHGEDYVLKRNIIALVRII